MNTVIKVPALTRAIAARVAGEVEQSFPAVIGGLVLLTDFFPTPETQLIPSEMDLTLSYAFDTTDDVVIESLTTSLEEHGVLCRLEHGDDEDTFTMELP